MSVLSAEEFVRIHNHENHDLRLRWGHKEYRIRANRDGMIPFGLAKKDFGDPRTQPEKVKLIIDQNTTEWIPSRKDDLNRLSTNYGNYENPEDYEALKRAMPNVAMFTIDGDELILPVDDPYCDAVMGLDADRDDREALMAEITAMRRRLMAFESMVESKLPDGEREAVTADESAYLQPEARIADEEQAFGRNEWVDPVEPEEDEAAEQLVGALRGMDAVTSDEPDHRPLIRPKAKILPRGIS